MLKQFNNDNRVAYNFKIHDEVPLWVDVRKKQDVKED